MTFLLFVFQLKVYFTVNILHKLSTYVGREDLFIKNQTLAAYVQLGYMCFCLFYAISNIKYTRALGVSRLPRTNFLTFLSTAMLFSDTCLPLYYNYLVVVLKNEQGMTKSVGSSADAPCCVL